MPTSCVSNEYYLNLPLPKRNGRRFYNSKLSKLKKRKNTRTDSKRLCLKRKDILGLSALERLQIVQIKTLEYLVSSIPLLQCLLEIFKSFCFYFGPRVSVVSQTTRTGSLHLDRGKPNEDRMRIQTNFIYDALFVNVLDGHYGENAAEFCNHNLSICIKKETENYYSRENINFTQCFKKGFAECERLFEAEARTGIEESGACGVACVIDQRTLHVANIGDCEAILSREGNAISLTKKHTCKVKEEVERIRKSGGKVAHDRLDGNLEVARSFGDFLFCPERKRFEGKPTGLIVEPHCQSIQLCPQDEFVILACDGIWDVLTHQQAVKITRDYIRTTKDLEKTSQHLIEHCWKRGSLDDMTCVVIAFPKINIFSRSLTVLTSNK